MDRNVNAKRRMAFGRSVAVLLGLIVIVAVAYRLLRNGPEYSAGPLSGSGIGGPFALVDQDGHAVTDRSFVGRYRLMYFGYTFCPDVCPTDLARNAAALRAFTAVDADRAARVQPIFVTVDPARDTPATLRTYVANFPPRLIGLTGSPAAVASAGKAYKVFATKQDTPGAAGYLMSHTDITYLMGPNGDPMAFFASSDTAAKVAVDLERYVH